MQTALGIWTEAAKVMNLNNIGRARSWERVDINVAFMFKQRPDARFLYIRNGYVLSDISGVSVQCKPCARHYEKQEVERP